MKENLELPLEMQLTLEHARRYIEGLNNINLLRSHCILLLEQRLFTQDRANWLVNQTKEAVELQQQQLASKIAECEFYKFLASNLAAKN
jgi:hypothetical protein